MRLMVQKKKISLGDGSGGSSTATGPAAFGVTGRSRASVSQCPRADSREVLELYFRTGTVFHDLDLGLLPDTVSGFVRRVTPAPGGAPVRTWQPASAARRGGVERRPGSAG